MSKQEQNAAATAKTEALDCGQGKENVYINWKFSILSVASQNLMCHTFLGDVVSSLTKTDLQREREISSICWLIPQKAIIAGAETI